MIYIWTRATLDWHDEDAFRAQMPPSLEVPVNLWNSIFRISFHQFRYRVRQIALSNHSRIADVVCTDWDRIPDGSVVIPVDDDDWFAPELGRVLAQAQDPGVQAYLWPARFLEIPLHLRHEIGTLRRRLFPATPNPYLFCTNNCAMTKTGDNKPLLAGHTRADAWFKANPGAKVRRLRTPLSLMNRTLGSTTALREKTGPLARAQMQLAAQRYRRLYQRPASAEMAWSRPYRDAMAELMEEL